MFGKNQLLKQVHDFTGFYWVQEVFPTIQGEGPLTGTPAVFIRMAGCNLRCHFCDTDFESSTWNPSLIELGDRIIEATGRQVSGAVTLGPVRLAVITGGEPLRQPLGPLVNMLLKMGMEVQVETAGTVWDRTLDKFIFPHGDHFATQVMFVCSPKTGTINPMLQTVCWHYKYIVNDTEGNASPDDGLPMFSTQVRGDKVAPPWRPYGRDPEITIWVQPETAYYHNQDANVSIVNKKQTEANTQHAVGLCMKYGYRLSLQTHRILGLP